jgi:hypothetical protein
MTTRPDPRVPQALPISRERSECDVRLVMGETQDPLALPAGHLPRAAIWPT